MAWAGHAGKALAAILVVPLVLSGIIDLMVLKNDPMVEVYGTRTQEVAWVRRNTEPNAVFLTNPTLYAGPELAGRRLYVGFDLFVVNVGYDAGARIEMARAIYRSPSKTEACRLLAEQGIDYVQIGPDEVRALEISTDLFAQEFTAAYREPTPLGEVALYSVEESCRGYGGPSSGA